MRIMNIDEYANKHIHYFSSQFKNHELKVILHNNKFKKLIDIGCGDGSLLYSMKANGWLQNFNEIWAVDLSQERLDNVKNISPDIKIVLDDAQRLSHVPDNYFDLIISRQVIEHVKDDKKMIESIHRICCKGSIVYLDTVFKNKYALYFYRNQYGKMALDPTHEREYQNENDLLEIIKYFGFKIIYSCRERQKFPLLNFFIRRLRIKNREIYNNPIIIFLNRIHIPIIGYYYWKIIFIKL